MELTGKSGPTSIVRTFWATQADLIKKTYYINKLATFLVNINEFNFVNRMDYFTAQ